jgi:hypothetical protein
MHYDVPWYHCEWLISMPTAFWGRNISNFLGWVSEDISVVHLKDIAPPPPLLDFPKSLIFLSIFSHLPDWAVLWDLFLLLGHFSTSEKRIILLNKSWLLRTKFFPILTKSKTFCEHPHLQKHGGLKLLQWTFNVSHSSWFIAQTCGVNLFNTFSTSSCGMFT